MDITIGILIFLFSVYVGYRVTDWIMSGDSYDFVTDTTTDNVVSFIPIIVTLGIVLGVISAFMKWVKK